MHHRLFGLRALTLPALALAGGVTVAACGGTTQAAHVVGSTPHGPATHVTTPTTTSAQSASGVGTEGAGSTAGGASSGSASAAAGASITQLQNRLDQVTSQLGTLDQSLNQATSDLDSPQGDN